MGRGDGLAKVAVYEGKSVITLYPIIIQTSLMKSLDDSSNASILNLSNSSEKHATILRAVIIKSGTLQCTVFLDLKSMCQTSTTPMNIVLKRSPIRCAIYICNASE